MSLVKRDEISVRNSSLELETGDINFSFNLLPPPSSLARGLAPFPFPFERLPRRPRKNRHQSSNSAFDSKQEQ